VRSGRREQGGPSPSAKGGAAPSRPSETKLALPPSPFTPATAASAGGAPPPSTRGTHQ